MRSAEIQERFARAVLHGDVAALVNAMVGGPKPLARLAIHQRHYESSLVRALLQKFPASVWLVGEDLVRAAARAYVHANPPARPCVAEYGRGFPAFLAAFAGSAAPPYVAPFGELEWAAGQASIAVAGPPLAWSDVARVGAEHLAGATARLQPGLHYRRCAWALDEPFIRYLVETQPSVAAPAARDTCIEVRGAYGTLSLTRLGVAAYVFRSSLAAGRTIEAAAGAALDDDPAFDAGAALRELAHAGALIGLSVMSASGK